MNTDLISRADAEALFRNARSKLNPSDYKTADEFNTRDLMLLNAEQMIHLLPSVTPQEPKASNSENPNKCEDCISRQAVLALPRNKVRDFKTMEVVCETINVTDIETLPPVNPQEPNMTWVTGADGAKIAFKDVPVWKVTKICEILGEPQESEEQA